MPFAFRSVVHERVGHYIEDVQPEAIDRHLDLLAHHYWHSGNLPKKREYLGRAGDAAQASYANPAAIDYFERLAPLLEGSARIDALLKLGQVVERVGDWHRAEQVEKEALLLAETVDDVHWRATSETALAEVARKQTRYDESFELLARAQRRFESLREEAGVAKVLHLMGTLAAQRGDYDTAVDSYEASLRVRERTGDKAGMGSLLSNLGVVAEYRGDYAGSRALHERALALRSEIGDRWGIAVSTGNLGMIALLQKEYAAAWDLFQKAIQLAREIGDPWMVALSHNNLGNATRGLGQYDAARSHYAESLRIYRNYDDRWSLAFLFEDVATLAALDNDPRAALALIGAATAARETIGAPRAPSQEEEIEARIGPSVAALSEAEQADWRARGRGLDLAAAVDYALRLCEGARAIAA